MFANTLLNTALLPKILVTVVDARVELPVIKRFPAVSVPEIVVEPEFKENTFAFWATKFVKVVEARVEEDVTFKFVVDAVTRFAVVAKRLVEVEFVIVAFVAVKFRTDKMFANSVPRMFKLIILEVAANN